MEDWLQNICKKLRSTPTALVLDKIARTRDKLTKLQQRQQLRHLMIRESSSSGEEVAKRVPVVVCRSECDDFELCEESTCDCTCEDEEVLLYCEGGEGISEQDSSLEFPEDRWHGYFRGYRMLTEAEGHTDESNKCIELTRYDCLATLEQYLRSGVRSFMIDLFAGTAKENQAVVMNLREAELRISEEIGWPVCVTFFAKLSPRMQYTGFFQPRESVFTWKPNDEVLLTTDRYYSTRCTAELIYVNARFLLDDVRPCDFLLVGPDIQLRVVEVGSEHLRCIVSRGGDIRSRTPVRFSQRCARFNVSLEELQDFTFAKEVGINIVVSYIPGSLEYFENLNECMCLLECDHLRLFTRLQLTEIKCGNPDDWKWIAESYDGFLVETEPQIKPESDILKLSKLAVQVLNMAHRTHKPIVLDSTPFSTDRLLVPPEHYMHIYLYPDKYLVRCNHPLDSTFFMVQNVIGEPLPKQQIAKYPYCDDSWTGEASLARACVATASETGAKAIFVVCPTGRITADISHFHPKCPIIFVTDRLSAADYVALQYNVTMLYYRLSKKVNPDKILKKQAYHASLVYKLLIYGIVYAEDQLRLRDQHRVILVYGMTSGTTYTDKYTIFKYSEKYYPEHLKKVLFT